MLYSHGRFPETNLSALSDTASRKGNEFSGDYTPWKQFRLTAALELLKSSIIFYSLFFILHHIKYIYFLVCLICN